MVFFCKIAVRVGDVIDHLLVFLGERIAVGIGGLCKRIVFAEVLQRGEQEILLPRHTLAHGVLLAQGLCVVQTEIGGIRAVAVHEVVELDPVVDLQIGIAEAGIVIRVYSDRRLHERVVCGSLRDAVMIELERFRVRLDKFGGFGRRFRGGDGGFRSLILRAAG